MDRSVWYFESLGYILTAEDLLSMVVIIGGTIGIYALVNRH